jgi:capsular exopolysaccharide synthesis family protein
MGKVYEALNKAEMERSQSYLSAYEANDDGRPAQQQPDQHLDEFDFLDYSLSAPPASEVHRKEQEMVSASRNRAWLAQPAREVNLDLGRIDPHLITFYDSDPRALEQYSKLAVALISGSINRRLKRLLVASAEHEEGRTCVLLNLACALSRAKKRVLVVDTDLRRPSVPRLLGIESETGLAETISNGKPPGESAIKVLPHDFVILPARERVENPAEILASPALAEMLATLEPDYDFILFDSSPLTTSADSSLLVRLTDTTLLVIRAGKTTSNQMARAIAPLSEDKIFGVVLNRAT